MYTIRPTILYKPALTDKPESDLDKAISDAAQVLVDQIESDMIKVFVDNGQIKIENIKREDMYYSSSKQLKS